MLAINTGWDYGGNSYYSSNWSNTHLLAKRAQHYIFCPTGRNGYNEDYIEFKSYDSNPTILYAYRRNTANHIEIDLHVPGSVDKLNKFFVDSMKDY